MHTAEAATAGLMQDRRADGSLEASCAPTLHHTCRATAQWDDGLGDRVLHEATDTSLVGDSVCRYSAGSCERLPQNLTERNPHPWRPRTDRERTPRITLLSRK